MAEGNELLLEVPIDLGCDDSKFAKTIFDEKIPETAEFWKIRTLKDALKNESQGPPWVIKDLLLKDTATLVSAHPHSMKSLSLLCACMEAVAKKPIWGHFAAPLVKKSLFIETEDPEWLVEARIRGFAKGFGIEDDLPGFFYGCVGSFNLVESKERIIDLLECYQPDFAVLSTLQGLLGGRDWTRQDSMSDVNALFVELSRRYCPLFVITHSPWNKQNKRAAGTITQAANFVTNVHFEKIKGNKKGNFIHVSIDSKAGSGETDFSLQLNTEGDLGDASAVRSLEFAGKGWPKGSKHRDDKLFQPFFGQRVFFQPLECLAIPINSSRRDVLKVNSLLNELFKARHGVKPLFGVEEKPVSH
jgi:hypothetical protein